MISPREFAERWTGNGSAEETADARKLEQLVADRDREHQESPSVIADMRRLVEEAKAETKRTAEEAADLAIESARIETELRVERDRLNGELAEARRLLTRAMFELVIDKSSVRHAVEQFLADPMPRCERCGSTDGKPITISGKLHFSCDRAWCWPPTRVRPAEQAQPAIDSEVKAHGMGQENAERAIGAWLAEQGADDVADKVASGEWRRESAEQAQGEGAPTCPGWCYHHPCGERCSKAPHVGNCDCLTHGKPAPDLIELRDVRSALAKTVCRIDGRVDELAKRMEALTNLVTSLARDSATQGAMVEVQNKLAALEAERPGKGWIGHYCDRPTACPHRMAPPAPPPPEAAGPACSVCGSPFVTDDNVCNGCCSVCRALLENCRCEAEAAGPGHAFVDGPHSCHICGCNVMGHPCQRPRTPHGVCGLSSRDPIHAVPPIPEGT